MRCALCGTTGAACGAPTISTPIDATISGRVIHDKVIPHGVGGTNMMVPENMTDEEREEFRIMSRAYEARKLRNQIMNDGEAGHTTLVYVRKPDGIITKMTSEVADEYVKINEGSEIIKRGSMPQPVSGDIFGASKAGVGEMFGPDGRQLHDVQPMTTRTFMAGSDDINRNATSPTLSHTAPGNRSETSSLTDEQRAAAQSQSTAKPVVPKPATKPAE